MAERRMERVKQPPKRVFINNIDSYASKYIAKFLSECVVGAAVVSDGETEIEEIAEDSKAQAFQIIGTVNNKPEEETPYVLEEYHQLEREELLHQLMDCDIIIYNITQHADQVDEASWVISALHNSMDSFCGPKMFILISTMMTWACSKPSDPEVPENPFTDEDFWRRRTHPNFKKHLSLEKMVAEMGKTNKTLLSTYVVASGLQYGMGEQVFHFFFKMSWLGQELAIPVFGEGNNVVPTIHINDLASAIQNIIECKPKPYYLLAVDSSSNTMMDIVKAVASVFGPGKIQQKPFEEAFLTQELSQIEIDSILVNLHMESVHLKELFTFPWVCEAGLVENIELVVDEYRQTRGLLPIRLCVLGPPAVGKSTVAEQICKHYKLHHIRLQDTISETIAQLMPCITTLSHGSNQSISDQIMHQMCDSPSGHLEDHLVIQVMKEKLKSKPCRNQGFVLDAFPETYEQAKELFYEDETEDTRSKIPPYNKEITPEFVFCLDASDAFLKDRVLNLPERLVENSSYRQEHFLQRLASYRENNVEDETILNYFDELDIMPQHMEISNSDDPEYLLLMQKISRVVGRPRNYGPSSQEVTEEERRRADEKIKRQVQERAEEEQREEEEARLRAERWEEWSKHLEEVRQQENDLLEAQSLPMRRYLMDNIMPTLTQGLIECCKAQPQDPVDFLAEYLFKNNPLTSK
uniref:Adenylate kinase 7b n=1 Tax=Myripristis murdjan TaxID=586833 RepID=A0A667XQH6_9TELE